MNKILDKAKIYCEKRGLRYTDPRRYVLQILLDRGKPMGAYDVLEALGKYIDRPKPPTAYRAIDFWREHGFVHKIESLNAFMACCTGHINDDHAHHDTHFLVCDDCKNVEEVHIHNRTADLPKGFTAKKTFIETHGTCATCS